MKIVAITATMRYATPDIVPSWRLYDQTVKYTTDNVVAIIAVSNICAPVLGDYFLWGIPEKAHTNITHMVDKVNNQT